MTALSAREDAQTGLLDPGTPTPAEYTAMQHLEDVATRDVRAGKASPEVWAAVVGVKEARRG